MKKTILTTLLIALFTISIMAQKVLSNAPYEREWTLVDSFLNQGLPESARTALNTLSQQLETTVPSPNRVAHRIKALLYQSSINAQLEEQGDWAAIQMLEGSYRLATAPEQAILASYLASKYHNYYQQNQWQIQHRTATPDQLPTEDETTWTPGDFLLRISELYLQSLEDTNLRTMAFASISPLIVPGVNADDLRPTVYDILLNRALDYFANNDAFLAEPAYEASFDDVSFLAPAAVFVQKALPTAERPSGTQRLLEILQAALRWSLQERPQSSAYVDLDLHRLQLVYDYLQAPDRHQAYEQALTNFAQQLSGQPAEAMVLIQLMQYYRQRGNDYSNDLPADPLRWSYKTAIELGKTIQQRFPDSYAAQQARQLQSEIEAPSFSVNIETVHLPDEPALVQLAYTNTKVVYFRILPLPLDEYLVSDNDPKVLKDRLGRKAFQAGEIQLPQSGDYRNHITESSFKGLPKGLYTLAISGNPDFPVEDNATVFAPFWVSELGLITGGTYQENPNFLVINRRTGAPVEGATVRFWTNRRYDSNKRQNLGAYTTDKDGKITATFKNANYLNVEIRKGEDLLFVNDNLYINGNNRPERQTPPYMDFFLDRGLYRPGQTVYFKGLALRQSKNDIPGIVANESLTVTLVNANNQDVAAVELQTNRFGSVTGSFVLPAGGLLGQMSLRASLGNGSSHYFQVEEYKRPRFEVKLDTLQTDPRLGDEVTLSGNAKAYAGPAVAGAKVVYTVTRATRFPWWYGGYNRYFPMRGDEQTIATGTTSTDDNGGFQLTFLALPDAALNADQLPQYNFTITLDVIDRTGETRSAKKTIRLAKYPFELSIGMAEEQDRQMGLALQLNSKNLENQPVRKEVTVVIARLNAPKNNFIDRYWPMPDTMLMSERSFRKMFPLFAYGEKDDPKNWPVAANVWKKTLTIEGQDSLTIATTDWPTGHYRVTMEVVIAGGEPLKTTQDFRIHDWQQQEFASGKWLYTRKEQATYQPGETLRLQWGQQSTSVYLYTELGGRQAFLREGWQRPGQQTGYTYPLTEQERGALGFQGIYVLHNRMYNIREDWAIPWTNKQLDISYETFHSRLYPDAEEEWIIRIDGPEKERVMAEVLASMYDASLDQILPFSWQFSPYNTNYLTRYWNAQAFGNIQVWPNIRVNYPSGNDRGRSYPSLWEDLSAGIMVRGGRMYKQSAGIMMDGQPAPMMAMSAMESAAATGTAAYAAAGVYEDLTPADDNLGAQPPAPPVKIRTNLNETAFFFPQLLTDEAGRVVLKFKAPESLTRWKLQLFAHTEDLAYAVDSKEVITQKELMVLPNAPRFLREGDQMTFTAKVSNLSDKVLAGTAVLELFDVQSGESLSASYQLTNLSPAFKIASQESQAVSWTIRVPKGAAGVLGYRVIARAGNFSDGEEAAIPVLTNRILLTEALPLFVRGQQTKTFELANLKQATAAADHQAFRLDITSNPAWEAIKALPYLQEYPYDCTEQIVNRLFANQLAATVVDRYPRIRTVFESWRRSEKSLQSPLLTDPELKTALLEETPWVLDAKDESLQRERIALLFDLDRLANEQAVALQKLLQRQQPSGGFSWFPDGRENWYITQYVVEQLAHLQQLTGKAENYELNSALESAVAFCDQEANKQYLDLKKNQQPPTDNPPSPLIAHYLYMRSLMSGVELPAAYQEMYDYWWQQADQHWLRTDLQSQGLLALAAAKTSHQALAQRIYASLRERSLRSDEQGRYWKYTSGYYWYQLPIETHVVLLEVFQTMGASEEEMAELKIWLLRNKETNRWETTKATAAAIFALVSSGDDWLGETTPLDVSFPDAPPANYQDRLATAQANAKAGTGAYSVRWSGEEVAANLATVRLKNRTKVLAWGAIYWQHFAALDEVTPPTDNPLEIERQLYRKINEGQGNQLQPLTTDPQMGDRITVRLVVRTDRDMEFVHLKDLRASGLEPLDQISSYHYQGGLGYYQQTTDLGTHFFFDYLPKGEYVLEYDLRVFHAGDFSGGLATLQCMYAPKFSSHSEGVRLKVN
ncbi:MAG: hypothetical protein DA408_03220 [Bacteroidetes bacterium]|nr:MAG: hypothetical protein C7N36_00995 [Bacteroidota bacterium]PTM14297.1 MAG: hypothetical protein DA408_03220 [Bacteroidota bacterium]